MYSIKHLCCGSGHWWGNRMGSTLLFLACEHLSSGAAPSDNAEESITPAMTAIPHWDCISPFGYSTTCSFKIADDIGNFLQMCFQWKKLLYFPYFSSTWCFDPKLSNGNISRFVLFMDLFFSRCSTEKQICVRGTGCDFRRVFTVLLLVYLDMSRCGFTKYKCRYYAT